MSKPRCGGEVVIATGGKITGTPYCSKCRLLLPWDQVSRDDFNYIHQAPTLSIDVPRGPV